MVYLANPKNKQKKRERERERVSLLGNCFEKQIFVLHNKNKNKKIYLTTKNYFIIFSVIFFRLVLKNNFKNISNN